MSYARRFDSEA